MIREHLDTIRARLVDFGLELPEDAHVFSNEPMGAKPWNSDWATHKASDLAAAARVKLSIKGLRHYTASQLLAARFDLRNTAARLATAAAGPLPGGRPRARSGSCELPVPRPTTALWAIAAGRRPLGMTAPPEPVLARACRAGAQVASRRKAHHGSSRTVFHEGSGQARGTLTHRQDTERADGWCYSSRGNTSSSYPPANRRADANHEA